VAITVFSPAVKREVALQFPWQHVRACVPSSPPHPFVVVVVHLYMYLRNPLTTSRFPRTDGIMLLLSWECPYLHTCHTSHTLDSSARGKAAILGEKELTTTLPGGAGVCEV